MGLTKFFSILLFSASVYASDNIVENIIITGMQTAAETVLVLSSDIGTMADRIGIMADRIVFTENMLAVLAHKLIDKDNTNPVVSTPIPQFGPPTKEPRGYLTCGFDESNNYVCKK